MFLIGVLPSFRTGKGRWLCVRLALLITMLVLFWIVSDKVKRFLAARMRRELPLREQ